MDELTKSGNGEPNFDIALGTKFKVTIGINREWYSNIIFFHVTLMLSQFLLLIKSNSYYSVAHFYFVHDIHTRYYFGKQGVAAV